MLSVAVVDTTSPGSQRQDEGQRPAARVEVAPGLPARVRLVVREVLGGSIASKALCEHKSSVCAGGPSAQLHKPANCIDNKAEVRTRPNDDLIPTVVVTTNATM